MLGSWIFRKNGSYSYGAKSRWGRPRVDLGANGVPLGQNMGQNQKKLPCPKIRIFDYTAVIVISQKNESYGYGAKSLWGPPNGPSWGQWSPIVSKIWVKTEKITMPQNSNFRLPCGHLILKKIGSHSYGAKSRWGPSRFQLGANGLPLGPKNGSKP